jgi:hypothetical protein
MEKPLLLRSIPVVGMVVSMLLFGTGTAQAETGSDGFTVRSEGLVPVEPKPDLPDRFKFAFGGFLLSDFNSTISLSNADLGVGAGFDPSQALGLDFKNNVLRIEGYYRFTKNQSLTYSWYSINSTGDVTLNEEINWVDDDGNEVTIPVGAQVQSDFGYNIYKVGYLWSFYRNSKVELGIGAGLHITRFKLNLNASATNPPGSSVEDVSLTAPLPVITLDLNYNITPRWRVELTTQWFAMTVNEWSGYYHDSVLGVEYRAWEHVALGAGLNANTLEVKHNSDGEILNFNQNINGGLVYIAAYF